MLLNKDFRRFALMGSAAVLALTIGAPAMAQDTAQDDAQTAKAEEEIVVTGFRAALQESVETKREADQIVESISAEDIGKLPDNSIADAIARLPGLTAQRLDGRAQVISIRGLAPDFSTTLLNGREQVTTGDNRGVEFDQYPSEIMSAVVVYKTPQASLVGQGLSGTVDLRTVRPIDYGKRVFAINARGEALSFGKLNPDSEGTGYRGSATYIDQFADDRIGVALSVTHLNSPTQVKRFNSWGYANGPNGSVVIGGAKPYAVSTELKRTAVSGSLQFRPTDEFTTTFDAFYSKFDDRQLLRGIEFPLAWGGATLAPGFTITDGLVTAGSFTGVKAIVRNDAVTRKADLFSFGWNGELKHEGWTIVLDANYSAVDRDDVILETNAGTGRNALGATDTVDFTVSPTGIVKFTPHIDYTDSGAIFLTSPKGWGDVPGGQDGFINAPHAEDQIAAFRTSVNRELGGGLFKNVEVGFNYTARDKSLDLERFYLLLKQNVADPDHDVSVPIPQELLLKPVKLGFIGVPGMVAYDPFALVDSGIYDLVPPQDANLYAFGWSASEDVLTTYAKMDIDSQVGSSSLTGNVGLQIVRTDQASSGLAASGNPAVVSPVQGGATYTNVLPSLNLSFRTPSQLVLRLGLSRQMARPRMDEMRASINFSYDAAKAGNSDVNSSPWGGGGGNPRLRPWVANAVDFSVEKYFGREGYVAGTFFYKDLKSYIYNQNFVYDFSGFPVPSGPEPVIREGVVSIPQNGKGGSIYGGELSAQLPFATFTEALDGFGVLGSVSYTKTNVKPNPSDPAQPLPGFSKYVASGTAYFEKDGISARVSARYRSSFRAEVVGVGTERILRQAKPETVIDAQLGYEFKAGPLQGLNILLQGQNLTDEPFVTYNLPDERRVIDNQSYGRRFLAGFGYKF